MQSNVERIKEMEARLDACGEVFPALREQLGRLAALKEDAVKLFAYYGSAEWYEDRDADLPDGLRAGVLSEDQVYDTITGLRDTAITMLETATDVLKEWV